ncbi:MAG: fibrillarin-like rRNA/tRNA 2'-O-methyltransferase [Candidatus Aenigmarchaeota archaeon]|nr:fibrillarin-like rRNA/tRNA 2'-O-methyltransferase [Candidatus Aenigmarchaeota archaeon]
MILMKSVMDGIYRFGKDFATLSMVPRTKVYDEKTINKGKDEYRIWDPKKSKLGAALRMGLKETGIFEGAKVLYLGIASGTTASHISDIVGPSGVIYGVEFSARSIRDLLPVSKKRKNIMPVLVDARLPQSFAPRIENVHILYQDIAQKDQSEIFIRNAEVFLKKGGIAMIAIKARSIDVTENPKKIFAQEKQKLSKRFNIIQQVYLGHFEKDHAFFLCRLK